MARFTCVSDVRTADRLKGLVYGDAEMYVSQSRYNKPGAIPLEFGTDIEEGCPYDCGLCADHQQHACLGIIEVNSTCNMDCPLCFSEAAPGFNLTLEEVEEMLDDFVRTEGNPEVVQFSGGEPTIHPQIVDFLRAAKARIPFTMVNTNGKRIANDDAFLAEMAEVRPSFYFQFDGFDSETYRIIRGEPRILEEKLRALDRLAEAGLSATLVPAIERGVNDHEVGKIIEFAIKHPAVRAVNFQPAFHAGRHMAHDPMERMTIPDVLKRIEEQAAGKFLVSDFVPVPCCFPTCNSVTYAFVDGEEVTPIPRLVDVHDYLGLHRQSRSARSEPGSSDGPGRPLVLVVGPRFGQIGPTVGRDMSGVRDSGVVRTGTDRRPDDHDHAAGFHGSLDLQPEETS